MNFALLQGHFSSKTEYKRKAVGGGGKDIIHLVLHFWSTYSTLGKLKTRTLLSKQLIIHKENHASHFGN